MNCIQNYNYKFITVIFSLLLLSFKVQASPICQSLFASYHEGVLQASKKGTQVFVLGSGEMGGVVRRIIDLKTKQSELEKEYYEPDSLFNDIGALKILGRLAESEPMVQIRQPKRVIEDEVLFFEDIKGYALDRLPEGYSHLKLREEFLYWALKIFDKAKKTKNMETNRLSNDHYWISYRVPLEERKDYNGHSVIDIILKLDNVIYDTQLRQMIIFDPY